MVNRFRLVRAACLTGGFALALMGCGSGGGGGEAGSGGNGGSGGSGGSGGGAELAPMTLTFEGRVGDAAFDCNATYTIGKNATEVKVTDYRLYVHDVQLVKADGSTVAVELDQDGLWQYENVALLDFENKTGACANGTTEVNTTIRGKAPAGAYEGIAFKVGVPLALNHKDVATAPSPLNLSALFWNWNGGYKFLRIDAMPTAGGKAFNMHLGSTGCTEDAMGVVTACERPNRPEVELSGFDPQSGAIVIDYAALVADSDVSQDLGGAPGCMAGKDDPECGPTMGRLGIHVLDGSIHSDEQQVFKVK